MFCHFARVTGQTKEVSPGPYLNYAFQGCLSPRVFTPSAPVGQKVLPDSNSACLLIASAPADTDGGPSSARSLTASVLARLAPAPAPARSATAPAPPVERNLLLERPGESEEVKVPALDVPLKLVHEGPVSSTVRHRATADPPSAAPGLQVPAAVPRAVLMETQVPRAEMMPTSTLRAAMTPVPSAALMSTPVPKQH